MERYVCKRTESAAHCAYTYAGFIRWIEAASDSAGANQRRKILMRHLKLIAAALALLALNACVGVIVPIPLSSSTTTQDSERNERR